MRYNILIYISLLCIASYAQVDSTSSPVISPPDIELSEYTEYDEYEDYYPTTEILWFDTDSINENLYTRKFETDFQDNYNTPEFDYSLTKPKESLWSKIRRKLSEFIAKFFRDSDIANIGTFVTWFMRFIAVVIIGIVVYWIVKYILSKGGINLFAKKDKIINPEAQTIQENIHEIDFNQLIQNYESKNNWRFAVRYQYLYLLKILNDNNLLEWDPDKTNLDYINEIKDVELKDSFRQLTHIFDYVWYGEFTIEQESYEKIKAQFNTLKQRI